MAEGAVPEVHHEQCDDGEVGILGRYEIKKERHSVRNRQTDEILWVLDIWRAPQLGCVALRTVRYDKNEKPTHDRIATRIVIGEPDPTLFEVPEGYVESSPLEAHQKLVELGVSQPFRDEAGAIMDRAERRYREAR